MGSSVEFFLLKSLVTSWAWTSIDKLDKACVKAVQTRSPTEDISLEAQASHCTAEAMMEKSPRVGQAKLLLLLMLACVTMAGAESYQKFLREHVDFPVSQVPNGKPYCDFMMKYRNMTTFRHCKHLNTFLHVDAAEIQAICGQGGQPTTGDLRESDASFPLTVCHLQKGSWAPDCRYQETRGTERIIIACEGGYPVHLQTEVPYY